MPISSIMQTTNRDRPAAVATPRRHALGVWLAVPALLALAGCDMSHGDQAAQPSGQTHPGPPPFVYTPVPGGGGR